jgi:uncharacterized protein (DUF305 family)
MPELVEDFERTFVFNMMAHRHTAVTISDRESAYTMDCL